MKTRKYKIRWIVNAVQLGKRGKRSINLGFCEKDKKVAFASILGVKDAFEFAKSFVICDVYVNNKCEDGEYCWNLECPHNRATPEILKKYVGKKCDSETLKIVSDRLQKCGEYLVSKIDWNEEGQIVYTEAPVVFYLKRKGTAKVKTK